MKAAYKNTHTHTHTKADVGEGESHSYDFPENNVFGRLFYKTTKVHRKVKIDMFLFIYTFFKIFCQKDLDLQLPWI